MASLCKNMEKEVCPWGRRLMKYTPESSTPLCDMSRIAFVSIASSPRYYPFLSKYKPTYFDKLSVKDKKTSQRYDGRVRKEYKNKRIYDGGKYIRAVGYRDTWHLPISNSIFTTRSNQFRRYGKMMHGNLPSASRLSQRNSCNESP